MEQQSDISRLLRLKRHEQPPPGYFEDFLSEFQQRQRAELIQRPMWEAVWDHLSGIAPSFRVPQYAYAAIAVLAVGASSFILTGQPGGKAAQFATASAPSSLTPGTQAPVTITSQVPVSTQSLNERPVQYILQSNPDNTTPPLSF